MRNEGLLKSETSGFFILVIIFGVLVVLTSLQQSPSFDEANHLRSGLTMLSQGQFVDEGKAWWTKLDPLHPPSDVLYGVAASVAGRSADFRSERFVDFNVIRAARIVSLFVGIGVLTITFYLGRRSWGEGGGLLSAIFLAICPLLHGHAGIVSSDLSGTFFGLLFVAIYLREPFDSAGKLTTNFNKRSFLLISLFFALAVVGKASNILLGVLTPLLFFAFQTVVHKKFTFSALYQLGACVCGFLIAAFVYDVALSAVIVPEDFFWKINFGQKLIYALDVAQGLAFQGWNVYVAETYQSPKWWHYLFFVIGRLPIGLILFLVLALFACLNRRVKALQLWLLVLGLVLFAVFSSRGFYWGLRHAMLPFVILSLCVGVLKTRKLIVGVLLALTSLEVISEYPNSHSFINLIAKNKLTFYADADWGQGLVALRNWQDESPERSNIWLSYFGNARPEDYGVSYQGLPTPFSPQKVHGKFIAGKVTGPGEARYIVISATNLTGRYLSAIGLPVDYYRKLLEQHPETVLANSLYVYRVN